MSIKTWQERVHKPGWAEKDMVAMVDEINDLRIALAERDTEIQENADSFENAEMLLTAQLDKLRTAAQQALDILNWGDLLCELRAAQLLTAALESK